MLLRNRAPAIDTAASPPAEGYGHVPATAIAVLHWLAQARVDYVLIGAVARTVRGERGADGPVAIVPAPYGRNLDRLARALSSLDARERGHREPLIATDHLVHEPALKLDAAKLLRPEGWALRCGDHDLDIAGRPAGAPSYQELLYETIRVEPALGVSVEVASPEDVELYDHVRRTGTVPEMVVTRP